MKKQVFYIHGGESYSEYDSFINRLQTKDIWDLPGTEKKKWTQTLARDLGDDFEVFTPRMPNSQNAKYEEWKIWFERHFEYLRDGVVIIGCSLGAMFLYKYFSENTAPVSIKSIILMASPATREELDFNGEDCGDFVFNMSALRNIPKKAETVTVMHSEDDFLVPFANASLLHEAMPGSQLVTFEDKNHFLIEEFPELVEHIKGLWG
ncbi:alpha/beta hydrolase [Candidatus Kaiserbacteria bacterium]|nr:alpha/beta hydrolase [Candidatus Kaiserbacteria bacterium]MCB9811471.1 alpha/beta hydrolase [Candidatus Nomurabacteria bacterium]